MDLSESPRDLHLIKKALAVAVLAMRDNPGPLSSPSDMHDMKLLLERLVEDRELDFYTRAAWIALKGSVPPGEE